MEPSSRFKMVGLSVVAFNRECVMEPSSRFKMVGLSVVALMSKLETESGENVVADSHHGHLGGHCHLEARRYIILHLYRLRQFSSVKLGLLAMHPSYIRTVHACIVACKEFYIPLYNKRNGPEGAPIH
jgi:hypothetical protein